MRKLSVAIAGVVVVYAPPARAGTITAQGNCTALTDYASMGVLSGQAAFDEGPTTGSVPLTQYTAFGLTFHTGTLTTALPGVTTLGTASQAQYATPDNKYPVPIGGNGIQTGNTNRYAGVATFDIAVTKFGLTASTNGTQYITAWAQDGTMLGQVQWTPSSDSSFVGIDCGAAAIKMIAYGNDDLWGGQSYGISGSTIYSDHWVWGGDTDCGNGALDAGEECDDGNNVWTDGCVIGCKAATCGDKFVWAGMEPCDDGNADNTDDCIDTCMAPSCGDGHVWAGMEVCDDANMDNTDGCLDTCQDPTCGDGHVWAGMEECDDGNADNQDDCKDDCTAPTCGDGFVQPGAGEACDDGNDVATDGCTDMCALPICGDGIVREFQEECDDGNMDETDACAACKNAACGDGFVQAGTEECDDANMYEFDECLGDCTLNPEWGGSTGGTTGTGTSGTGAGSTGEDTDGAGSTTGAPQTTGPAETSFTSGADVAGPSGCSCTTDREGGGAAGLLALLLLLAPHLLLR